MVKKPAQIWEGDKLQRRAEARQLERFLDTEARTLLAMGREQAFVLALDAQYGEGKSWFLKRFREQLEQNHPIAFIDAWVDDANHEPLVTIMAAIEDAMKPFLRKKSIATKLSALTRAALPIIGKAAVGAAGKATTKYLGSDIGHKASAAVAAAEGSALNNISDDAQGAFVDKTTEGVADIVDKAGKAMLDQYRVRQKSREEFKKNLKQLAASIESSPTDSRHSPIFIIIDELDRCRPNYAISLLEEIKHLFDVPGVVFVIALHGGQLEHSIKAVYGEGFDARSYLRRFFTRRYEMRRLSIMELVESHFDFITSDVRFSAPTVKIGNNVVQMPPAKLAGGLLSEWGTTPREAEAIIDALRIFIINWEKKDLSIELPLVLGHLFNLIRGSDGPTVPPSVRPREIVFAGIVASPGYSPEPKPIPDGDLLNAYNSAVSQSLPEIVKWNPGPMPYNHVQDKAYEEYRILYNMGHPPGSPPRFSWSDYAERVRHVGRFIEVENEEEQELTQRDE